MLSSLFKIERKQNESLKDQVHRLNSEKRSLHIANDELSVINQDISIKSKLIEEQIGSKCEEIEAMNIILDDTKSQLFHAMNQVRESDSLKCLEQRKVQELENQKNHLMSEVNNLLKILLEETNKMFVNFQFSKLKSEMVSLEKKYRRKRDEKDEEILSLKAQISSMEEKCAELVRNKDMEIQEFVEKETQYCLKETELNCNLERLKEEIQNSLPNKFRFFLKDIVLPNGRATLQMIHFLTFLLLPAFPPPTQRPFKVDLKKAIELFRSPCL